MMFFSTTSPLGALPRDAPHEALDQDAIEPVVLHPPEVPATVLGFQAE